MKNIHYIWAILTILVGACSTVPKREEEISSRIVSINGTPTNENLPDLNWWDDVMAFCGSDCKMGKYLNKGCNAYGKGLFELAEKYANQALECNRDSWKPYAMLGYIAFLKKI